MNKFLRRMEGIKKAKRVVRANPLWRNSFRLLIKTRKPCSCMLCGHPRKWFGKTRQEKLADRELYEEMRMWEEMSIQTWLDFERKLENEQ